MKYFLSVILINLLFFSSCKNESAETNTKKDILVKEERSTGPIVLTPVQAIEKASQKDLFLAKKVVSFNIKVLFGGKERVNGRLTMLTNSSKGKLEFKNGTKIYTIGGDVYHSPEIDNLASVKFDAFTWSYFFALPYKLNDPGTIWSNKETVQLMDKAFNMQRLTFASGTGDTPKDWYDVYSNSENNLIEMVTYIVTAGKTIDKAEANPHTITYEKYKTVENIPISTHWKYWEWENKVGITTQIGEAILSDFKFSEPGDELFTIPKDFKKIK